MYFFVTFRIDFIFVITYSLVYVVFILADSSKLVGSKRCFLNTFTLSTARLCPGNGVKLRLRRGHWFDQRGGIAHLYVIIVYVSFIPFF